MRPLCILWLGAAVLARLGVGIGLWVAGVNPDHPLREGALMSGAAGLVTSLLIWMWQTGWGIRAPVEHRLDAVFPQPQSQVDWKAALATFGLVFLMVFREGAEIVVFILARSRRYPGYPATGDGLRNRAWPRPGCSDRRARPPWQCTY